MKHLVVVVIDGHETLKMWEKKKPACIPLIAVELCNAIYIQSGMLMVSNVKQMIKPMILISYANLFTIHTIDKFE